ncbi:MAG: Methyltransferase type 11, partial [Anaerolineales bacterium]|nr:Methyltransferase type 11 [Anaerolineales bacterium]
MNRSRISRLFGSFLRWFFRHLYTTLAWSYDAVAWLSSLGQWSAWRRTALPRVPPGSSVLELGFGTGHLQVEAGRRGLHLFGVDASAQMARLTLGRLRRARLPLSIVRAQAQALPFLSHAGSAFTTFPSEYIFDPITLVEIRRVLVSDGLLIVVLSARIRPRFPWEHVTRWLYDRTGQAPGPDSKWLDPFLQAGLAARYET